MRSAVREGIACVGPVDLPDPEPGPRRVVLDVVACPLLGTVVAVP